VQWFIHDKNVSILAGVARDLCGGREGGYGVSKFEIPHKVGEWKTRIKEATLGQ
jgi:hypothetical protein